MGESTAIAWTDHTFNPWWGCTRVSPGCTNCYAEAFAKRTGKAEWGKNADRRFFGDKHWDEPVKWNKHAAGRARHELVFCASMADVFEARDDLDEHRERLWALIEATPALIWQLLTKRPENVMEYVPWKRELPTNMWIGTTTEDQERADQRIPHLLKIPALKFISYEPAIGPVVLPDEWLDELGWVIVGGESGNNHRPFDPEWARSMRDQCSAAAVPFFFKQHGGRYPTSGGDLLDGMTYKDFPEAAWFTTAVAL